MQRLENGRVRLEFHDYDNDIHFHKDITPEMAKTFTTRTEVWIDEVKNTKLPDSYNSINEYASCKTYCDNMCAVEVTRYIHMNGKPGRDEHLYPQIIYYD